MGKRALRCLPSSFHFAATHRQALNQGANERVTGHKTRPGPLPQRGRSGGNHPASSLSSSPTLPSSQYQPVPNLFNFLSDLHLSAISKVIKCRPPSIIPQSKKSSRKKSSSISRWSSTISTICFSGHWLGSLDLVSRKGGPKITFRGPKKVPKVHNWGFWGWFGSLKVVSEF